MLCRYGAMSGNASSNSNRICVKCMGVYTVLRLCAGGRWRTTGNAGGSQCQHGRTGTRRAGPHVRVPSRFSRRSCRAVSDTYARMLLRYNRVPDHIPACIVCVYYRAVAAASAEVVRRVGTFVRVLLRCANKAPRFCAGGLRAYMSLCRYGTASGNASGSGGIGARVPIWKAGLPAGSGSSAAAPV